MNGKTILVVDDDRTVREVVAVVLGSKGFVVLQAESGGKAIEIARTVVPDLVLLDVSMPEMDGLEVCRRLRSDPSTAGTRVIMLTGKSAPGDLTDALAAGADSYFSKPFSPSQLLEVVSERL